MAGGKRMQPPNFVDTSVIQLLQSDNLRLNAPAQVVGHCLDAVLQLAGHSALTWSSSKASNFHLLCPFPGQSFDELT